MSVKEAISAGKVSLGIELGSTRIKSVLIDENFDTVAVGSFTWENQYINEVWTYNLDDAIKGLQASFSDLTDKVKNKYDVTIESVMSIGVSAMMHGYLVFDKDERQLVPFRTWRNTITEDSAEILTDKFNFNVPQRWNIAHLYQAILNKEEHVSEIDYLTTLSGYIHWKLTGKKVIGVGDASGIFPIDSSINNYNPKMINTFNGLIAPLGFAWEIEDILPKVLVAGEDAGVLSEEGAKLIDPSGKLRHGVSLCPPEGDAGTGMVATNSIAERTGNVSAGTSIFSMIVLEKELKEIHTEIDMVTTPTGKPVAMIHCNNFTSDIDAWVKMFNQIINMFDTKVETSVLYERLFKSALEGEADGGGIVSFNYLSGEPITELNDGRPLVTRLPDSKLSIENFMRVLIFSSIATLRIGTDIIVEKENVMVDRLIGHGGFFKTELVGQKLMSAALETPITVMKSAGEGGAWGIAVLAAYLVNKKDHETLEDYLKHKVFAGNVGVTVEPEKRDIDGFKKFLDMYKKSIAIEKTATESI